MHRVPRTERRWHLVHRRTLARAWRCPSRPITSGGTHPIAGVLALAGAGNADGAILNFALVAANAFVVYALATTGPWFAR